MITNIQDFNQSLNEGKETIADVLRKMTREELEFIVYQQFMLHGDEDNDQAYALLKAEAKLAKNYIKANRSGYVINDYDGK